LLAAKARALLRGRLFVAEEDLVALAAPVLRHRLILSFEAEAQGILADSVVIQTIADIRRDR
jgi:MoxR-like ATPase